MTRPSRTGSKTSGAKARNASAAKGRKITKTKRPIAPTATRVKGRSVSGPRQDLKEAREQQTATAEILKVIASSPSDVQTVFEAIVASANLLIGGYATAVFPFIDGYGHLAAFTPINPDADEKLKAAFPQRIADVPMFRWAQAGEVLQVDDTEKADERLRDIARARGFRSVLYVPLKSKGTSIGVIATNRRTPGPFSTHEVQLLETFADQAVIAIENVRLFDEVQAKSRDLTESLQQQTATADVLKVISRSAFDLQTVLDTLVESAAQLCEADEGIILQPKDDGFGLVANWGLSSDTKELLQNLTFRPGDGRLTGRVLTGGNVVHIRDVLEEPDLIVRGDTDPARTRLGVPLLRDGTPVGVFVLTRRQVRPFTDRQIELVQTFADQAVIAIENVRLFDEVQQRTRDLSEALQQQTATSEVLRVISSSSGELQPVFKVMLDNALKICEASYGNMLLSSGDGLEAAELHNTPPAFAELFKRGPLVPPPGTALGRVIATKKVVHIPDILAESGGKQTSLRVVTAESMRARTLLAVPMLRESELVGVIVIYRQEVRQFSEKQIELVTNFADQAVIAIENTRLLKELRQRTDDLSESLQQQTATADVLQIISSSPGDLAPVFEKMLVNATRVCSAKFGTMLLAENGSMRPAAQYNVPAEFAAARGDRVLTPHPKSALAKAISTKQVVHVADMRTTEAYLERSPASIELVELGGARTVAIVPMLRDDEVIGEITVYRNEVQLFSDKQIELLSNFAKQAVIAIENARLLKELRQRTDDLSKSLDDLRTAQDRLVQTEKLASLGQLTAGIAHEIKNPLNFVNNFSALSAELTDELNDVLKPVAMDGKVRGEVDELTSLLKDNLEKVVQHGKRADSIVKNMLLHSREGSGEHRPTDINALLDESLNLAYHGARAEKGEFNITVQRDFDADAGTIELFPQEITRAFLNLIANAVYAATRRKTEDKEPGFEPTLRATTKNLGSAVEIRIRDNGTGIPAEVQEKMFNPFFTTKPAGEGTGLGLSMTHDIIVKQHGGRIDVATEPGQFTEFTIVLPRKSNFSGKDRGET